MAACPQTSTVAGAAGSTLGRFGRVAKHVPVAAVTRGGVAESVHCGSVAVADSLGNLISFAGDPMALTMTRSALKPLQAMPFAAAGGIERFGFSTAQAALLCASHSGEPRHVAAVADMLARAGNTVEDLQCGTHAPGFYEQRGEIPPPPPYSPLAHNCSGKHSGMLAYCTLAGWPKRGYLDYDHPLQRAIRGAVAHFTSTPESGLVAGIDGCSAPNYAVPLVGLATAYARLAARRDDPCYGAAPRRLADAMTEHPEMVSGEGRSDLVLARAGRGDWLAKIGAEGVQAIGFRDAAIGIAVKIGDGNKRALAPVVVSVLDRLGMLDAGRRAELDSWFAPVVRNYRGIATGRIESMIVLDNNAAAVRARVGALE